MATGILGMTLAESIMAISAATSAAASVGFGISNEIKQDELAEDQKEAIADAKAEQQKAEKEAETERLEALAAEQTGGNRVEASDFGIDSALARRYLDENNKRQAKAQQMLEEEENPFYTRGLV